MLGRRFSAAAVVATVVLVAAACVPSTPAGSGASPTAIVVASTLTGAAPLAVTFDGTGSSDPDGTVKDWAWDFGDGSSGAGPSTTHTFVAAGTFTVTLTVTDNSGRTGAATRQVVVDPPNAAPSAGLAATPLTGKAPLAVTFDGSSSRDVDGTITAWAWDFGDGGTATGQSATHTFTDQGSYTVTLTVTDDDGATGSTSLVLGVGAANSGPSSSFSTSVGRGKAPLGVTFDARGSVDLDGSVVGYEWDFGDGANATGPTPQHTFTEPGAYTVVLQVTDNDGAVGTTSRPVVVAPANVRPTSSVSASTTSGKAPVAVTFDGSGSTDPDGTVTSWAWDFGDGSSGSGVISPMRIWN